MSLVEKKIIQQLGDVGVELIVGTPIIKNSKEVVVGDKSFFTEKIVVATGTQTNELLSCPIDGDVVLSHKELVALPTLPKSIIIIGGNVEGIEFASYLSGFDVDVTIIAMGSVLLEGTDRELCKPTIEFIKCNKGTILLETTIREIKRNGFCGEVYLADGSVLTADKVLITGARSGNIPETVEMKFKINNSCIVVDDYYETSEKDIYAIGDINGLHGMAHIAIQQGIQLADYLFSNKNIVRDYESLPRAIFTMHEIAGAGVQEEYCLENDIVYSVKTTALSDTFRGWSKDIGEGMVKIILDQAETVIGVWISGENASDYVGQIGLWIDQKRTISDIKASLFIHPSMGEGILDAIIK